MSSDEETHMCLRFDRRGELSPVEPERNREESMQDGEFPECFVRSDPSQRQWDQLPLAIQRKSLEKFRMLAENPRHPSLQIHLVSRTRKTIWIGYLNMRYRVLFQHEESEKIRLLEIGSHAIIDRLHRKNFRSPQASKKGRYRSTKMGNKKWVCDNKERRTR